MYNQQNIASALSRIENKQLNEQFPRTGFYRALVVSNDDPLRLGRVKIRIPALHGGDSNQLSYVSDDMLPYAYPGAFSGAGYEEGQYLLPSQGHIVWVSFEAGTENIIYFGGIYSERPDGDRFIYGGRDVNNGQPVRVIGNDIPNNYRPSMKVLYRSLSGDIIYIDNRDNLGSIVIRHSGGSSLVLSDYSASINSENPLHANYPYLTACFLDISKVTSNIEIFEIERKHLFDSYKLENIVDPVVGNVVIYVSNGDIKGAGIISSAGSDKVFIYTTSVVGSGGGSGGTMNYNELDNKPSLNSITLQGNRDVAENPLTNQQIENLLK